MKILIVDDHILFRQGLASLIKSQSTHEVVGEAGSVYEGIAKARLLKPDLVLMDYSLPDGTGVEAMDAILAEHPESKIIFLTIQDADETLLTAVRRGARGYLLKNMPINDLVASLNSVERGEHAMTRAMASRALDGLTKAHGGSTGKADESHRLSPREIDVLHELAQGATNQEIAQRLFLSENTVKHHLHNILEKMGLENRRQAAEYARQHRL